MKTTVLSPHELDRAAALIQAGQLVAFPTETVYGLGASAWNEAAIRSIFQVKGRPSDNPLIVHVHSLEQVAQVACDIPPLFYPLARAFWPGPLTFVLKRHPQIPSLVSAGLESVAVRMPSHPVALELILRSQAPLVAPSANLSGKPSPTCLQHVLEDFSGVIAAVIEGGESEWGIESTVISLLNDEPVLLRPGSITVEQIEEQWGGRMAVVSSAQSGPVLSPGMKYRHYAPQCPIVLVETVEELLKHLASHPVRNKMVLSHSDLHLVVPSVQFHLLSAKTLYALLRHSDRERIEEIIVLCDQKMRSDGALMNRLMKAASRV